MTIVLNIELFSNKNVKKLIKDVKEEEVMRILAQLIENQKKLFELQKQLLLLQEEDAEKRRRKQEREWRRRKYDER